MVTVISILIIFVLIKKCKKKKLIKRLKPDLTKIFSCCPQAD